MPVLLFPPGMAAAEESDELLANNIVDCLDYSLSKPLMRRVIVLATMPNQEKTQSVGLDRQRSDIQVL